MELLVSIIVPVYNRQNTLARTAQSALSQSWKNLEVILVDDGSSDASLDVAKRIQSRDPRVRVLTNERTKGASGARNTGLDVARGEWITFLDSDDLLDHRMIERLVGTLKAGRADIVTCHTRLMRADGTREKKVGEFRWNACGDISESILSGEVYVDMNAALIQRESLLDISGLDEDCPSFQEWDLHIRLSKSCQYACCPELLVDYYQHPDQMSKDAVRSMKGLLFVYRKHKNRWANRSLSDNWKQRIFAAFDEIGGLPRDRLKLYADLARIEPRIIYWLPCRLFRRIAGWIKRRELTKRRQAAAEHGNLATEPQREEDVR